jgi:hypothetical protein
MTNDVETGIRALGLGFWRWDGVRSLVFGYGTGVGVWIVGCVQLRK